MANVITSVVPRPRHPLVTPQTAAAVRASLRETMVSLDHPPPVRESAVWPPVGRDAASIGQRA